MMERNPNHRPRLQAASQRALLALAIWMTLFAAGGANCGQWVRQYRQPRTLPESATLEQVVNTINANTAKVQSMQSTQASLSVPGIPSLRANVSAQEPSRMRLRADSSFGGPELDLGSNGELFWLWVRRNQPPALFVCRNDQFATSSARQIMPVEPAWLLEAVGLVKIDGSQPIDGPSPVGSGRLQIRSRQPSAVGILTKVTVVDAWDGTVVEQHLYDSQNRRLASSITNNYSRDPLTGAALPRSIEIQWPTAQMNLRLDVKDWLVNSIPLDNATIFEKPQYPGYPDLNLADPNLRLVAPGGAPPVANPPPMIQPSAASSATFAPIKASQPIVLPAQGGSYQPPPQYSQGASNPLRSN